MVIGEIALKEKESYAVASAARVEDSIFPFGELDCLVEYRMEDRSTGVQFRDCRMDYTRCPNQKCVKKLV